MLAIKSVIRFTIYLVIFILSLFFVIGLVVNKSDKASVEETEHTINDKKGKITFNPLQEKIVKMFLFNEVYVFLEDGDSFFKEDIVKVKATKLFSDYDSNEVKADQIYRHKELIVDGTIYSIDRSIGENYYITLKVGKSFDRVHALFDEKHLNILASLKKEQKIKLHCIGDGMLMHIPTLKDCQPIEDWIMSKVESQYKTFIKMKELINVRKFDELKKFDEEILISYIIAGMYALTIPDDHYIIKKIQDSTMCYDPQLGEEILKDLRTCEKFITQNPEIQEAKATYNVDRLIKIIKEAREKAYSESTNKNTGKKVKK